MSIQIRDPGLTARGREAAAAYGPILLPLLEKEGFRDPIVCSSTLRRAQETAHLVFGSPRILTGFSENGEILENTPLGGTDDSLTPGTYEPPNWEKFLEQLVSFVSDGDSVAVVGHGAFLQSLWPILTGAERPNRLNNLDGILCEVDLSQGFKVLSHKEYLHTAVPKSDDMCIDQDADKIARLNRMKNKQRGGTNTPLAIFKDGAQMHGTYAETSAQPSSWFRAPLAQTGGHKGGFSPSVMGSFATNGLRLMPVAAYMGYKMYSKTRKVKKSKSKSKSKSRKSKSKNRTRKN
jgi:phosphohistidine phosphatase SixA